MRVYGGILVSAEMQNGSLTHLVLEGGKAQTVRIKNTFATTDLTIRTNSSEKNVSVPLGEMIEVYHDGGITEIVI